MPTRTLVACLALTWIALTAPARAGSNPDQILLAAPFNDRPLNAQIGTGGAAVGEPVSISENLQAVVVPTSLFASPHLRIRPLSTSGSRFARFELLDSAEVRGGEVRVGFVLRPAQLGRFLVSVREQATAADRFLDLTLLSNGQIAASAQGDAGLIVGTYTAGAVLAFELRFRVDAGTYSIVLNGSTIATNRPIGVTSGRGVGAVLFGTDNQATVGHDWFLDDVYVYRPDRLQASGFEASGL